MSTILKALQDRILYVESPMQMDSHVREYLEKPLANMVREFSVSILEKIKIISEISFRYKPRSIFWTERCAV